MQQELCIIGAGKIGRGFLADIFGRSGYDLTVVDADPELVGELKKRGEYTLINIPGKDKREEHTITIADALHTENDREAVLERIASLPLLGVAVFPQAFDGVAELMAVGIKRRRERSERGAGETVKSDGPGQPGGAVRPGSPLDIIMCANVVGPAQMLRERIEDHLEEQDKEFFRSSVGLVDSLVMRIGIEPTPEMKQEDPLTVVTNGFPYLVVDREAFKGTFPKVSGLEYSDNIQRDEIRKIYTYNMIHAVFAYLGYQKGYTDVLQCLDDEQIMRCAREALQEAGAGLQAEYDLSDEESNRWHDEVMTNMTNPALADAISRIGRDPARKITRDGRLTGPALVARKHGYYPHYLGKALAAALLFDPEGDPTGATIKHQLWTDHPKQVIRQYCGLDREPELVQSIYEQYCTAASGTLFNEDPDRIEMLKRAYRLGYEKERIYHGCAQCTLAALFELTGSSDPGLFQAASGLAGGMGLCGDGSCGGYIGGVLFMGSKRGRRLEYIDGDKEDQYASFEMAQKLRQKYIDTYGSVTCRDIHQEIFGKVFILRTREVRHRFEEAGAHLDKCTTVIANAVMWTAELLEEEGLI